MTPFSHENPFDYNAKDEEYKGFRLGCYHESSGRNPNAIIFFVPDFAVTARSFGSFFFPFANDSELQMRTYCFDRRGFGTSQGERGLIETNELSFRDYWNFIDSVAHLRGYPQTIPKVLVSQGLGSLIAAHMCGLRPGFFTASVSIAPWLGFMNRPSVFTQKMLQAKKFMPRPRGYASQDLHWRDQYLTADFKEALQMKDHLYLYDRLTS